MQGDQQSAFGFNGSTKFVQELEKEENRGVVLENRLPGRQVRFRPDQVWLRSSHQTEATRGPYRIVKRFLDDKETQRKTINVGSRINTKNALKFDRFVVTIVSGYII